MTLPRLSATTLPRGFLPAPYDRDAQKTGVVHLGTGAFHRAHQAFYFDALMAAGEANWMIEGASLRSASVASQLGPQDGLYTVTIRAAAGEDTRLMRSVRAVHVAPQDPGALIAAMAQPSVALVTLTVTEKGYKPSLASGGAADPDRDVQHDLANPDSPVTALGFIATALARRMETGAGPLTVLSCDNLPSNGVRTKEGVMAFAAARSPALADWIEAQCTFPSSMVDRIVPATTQDDIDGLARRIGVHDEAMVKTEGFTQWVIEDSFAARRPPLEKVGVQMVRDVHGWEMAKLRLLNGSHSAMAYLGPMIGHTYVHEAIADPAVRAFVERLWDEQVATLPAIEGFDAGAYRAALIERFENPALNHRLVQIAMDGSQKIPQRLVAPLRERKAQGMASPAILMAIAAWMRWQFASFEDGTAFTVDDPMVARLGALVEGAGRQPDPVVRALLGVEEVFGAGLAQDEETTAQLARNVDDLAAGGAFRTLTALTATGD